MTEAPGHPRPGDPRDTWQLHGSLQERPVRFEFDGPFEGRTIRWHARLWPRAEWNGRWPCPADCRQFMRIGPDRGGARDIELVLDLDRIDPRGLMMAIIMVRKYRRLREGVICFHGRENAPDHSGNASPKIA